MSGVCQPQAPKTFRMFCRDIPIDWIPKNTSDVTQVYQENGVSIGIGLNRSLSPDGLVKVRHYVETNDPLFFGLLAVAYSFSSEAFAPYVWPLRVEDDDCVSKILTTGSLSTIAWRASRAKVYGTAVVNAAIGLETACDTIWTQNEFNMVCTTLRDRLLAAVSDKNAYRELLDTFFVAETDRVLKHIRWGRQDIYVPRDPRHARLFTAATTMLGGFPSASYLTACIKSAEKTMVKRELCSRDEDPGRQ